MKYVLIISNETSNVDKTINIKNTLLFKSSGLFWAEKWNNTSNKINMAAIRKSVLYSIMIYHPLYFDLNLYPHQISNH